MEVPHIIGALRRRRVDCQAATILRQPTVWDATGGLGRDSFVLASLGLNVHTFEQNPAVACLLSDGLNRAGQSEETREIAQRITLHFGNAVDLMQELATQNGRPDVVYLDPMYPERRKTAAVKKKWLTFTTWSARHKMKPSCWTQR